MKDLHNGSPFGMDDKLSNHPKPIQEVTKQQNEYSEWSLSRLISLYEMNEKSNFNSLIQKVDLINSTAISSQIHSINSIEGELEKKKIRPTVKDSTTILIAEDEEINFILLNEMLSHSKISILRASNGMEAVDLCQTKDQIDLVLMDVRMPIMNGLEATKLIKVFRPSLPIIIQTAFSSESDRLKAFESGCSDFISKPISKDLLIMKINRLVGD
jgi:CheY-like chemotaxis protein